MSDLDDELADVGPAQQLVRLLSHDLDLPEPDDHGESPSLTSSTACRRQLTKRERRELRQAEREGARAPLSPRRHRSREELARIFERYPLEDGSGDSPYLRCFTPDEASGYLEALQRYGMVVVQVLDEQACEASVAELQALDLGGRVDLDDAGTWDNDNWPLPKSKFLMSRRVALGQQAFDNRVCDAMYDVWRHVYGRDDLWTSIDHWGVMRGTRNLEIDGELVEDRPEWRQHLPLHWDVGPHFYLDELERGLPRLYQALVALVDCPPEVGGLRAVPGSHKHMQQWCREHVRPRRNGHRHVRLEDDDEMQEWDQPVPLRRGQMVIFDSGLAHGTFPNNGPKMRLYQFVRMMPADEVGESRDRCAPRRLLRLPKYAHVDLAKLVALDERGRKLVGLDDWDNA